MWAILLRLGVNTNAKPGDCRPYEMEDEFCYHEKLFCDKEIWRKVTEYLPEEGINTVVIDINEGVKLDSHPELAVSGSWEKEELKEELRRLRSLGLTPIPKFNFSCAHNAWLKEYAYQIGTDTYRQVCEDIVAETIEIFDNPEFFHLGMDNEETEYQKYSPVQIVRSWKQKTEDALALFNICLEKGVRPWIWLNAKNVEEYGMRRDLRPTYRKRCLYPTDVTWQSTLQMWGKNYHLIQHSSISWMNGGMSRFRSATERTGHLISYRPYDMARERCQRKVSRDI